MNGTGKPKSTLNFTATLIMFSSGLLPFIGCALAVSVLEKSNPLFEPVVEIFKTWSVIILAWMAGVRWGSAIFGGENSLSKMSVATLLPPAGLSALFISGPIGVLVLLLIYCVQSAWDSFSGTMSRAPHWYTNLRIMYILTVAACHIIVFVAIY